jgi:hypothetical protein|nr:MAG TPA: hypothetical protein [Caudoviricetes sp.]
MLQESDLKPGRVYSAKKPQIDWSGLLNDRQILWIGQDYTKDGIKTCVQYDSPTVSPGRKYPTITAEKFLKWAAEDVTDQMPKGEWRTNA